MARKGREHKVRCATPPLSDSSMILGSQSMVFVPSPFEKQWGKCIRHRSGRKGIEASDSERKNKWRVSMVVASKLLSSVSKLLSSYERGLFTRGISRISRISKFSRISRKWSNSLLFATVWEFFRISRISEFSTISTNWTFLKRPLFQKTPYSEPDRGIGTENVPQDEVTFPEK